MNSWKTTLCGVLGIIGGTVATFNFHPVVTKIAACVASIASSLGLMFARDNNVTSEQAGAKSSNGVAVKLGLVLLLALPLMGCKSLAPDGVYQGDKVAYEADTIIVTSYDALHSFVKWEHDNRAALVAWPEIKSAADNIRLHAKDWIQSAIAAKEAYTLSPSPDARDKLTRSLAVLRAALSESVKYLSQHQTP